MSCAAGDRMRERIPIVSAHLTEANGRPPTNREIGQHLGGKSTSHIAYHMREHGTIQHEPHNSRGIQLLTTLGVEAALDQACPSCPHLRAEIAELRARLAELQASIERAS